jgi:hypothetical protein
MASCAQQGVGVFALAASPDATQLYGTLGFVPYAEEMICRI